MEPPRKPLKEDTPAEDEAEVMAALGIRAARQAKPPHAEKHGANSSSGAGGSAKAAGAAAAKVSEKVAFGTTFDSLMRLFRCTTYSGEQD